MSLSYFSFYILHKKLRFIMQSGLYYKKLLWALKSAVYKWERFQIKSGLYWHVYGIYIHLGMVGFYFISEKKNRQINIKRLERTTLHSLHSSTMPFFICCLFLFTVHKAWHTFSSHAMSYLCMFTVIMMSKHLLLYQIPFKISLASWAVN